MAKKQKEEVNTPQETPQPIRQLSNEEKELLQSALKLVIAKRRQSSLATTLVTLAKHVQLLLPFSVDLKMIIEYIRGEITKNYRIVTIHDKIGNDVLPIEVVLLHNSIEELLEEFQKKKVDAMIKIVDAGLDSVSDYKQ
jgi:phosphopantetheine adenylyltransferase